MADAKRCTKCHKVKDLSSFVPSRIYNDGYTYWCKSCLNLYQKRRYHSNPDMVKRMVQTSLRYRRSTDGKAKTRNSYLKLAYRYKMLIIQHYSSGSMSCACCGEKLIEFLSLDHINGGGNQHRKKVKKSGVTFYMWLFKNNYPSGYRILCFNCNQAFGNFGNCPHKGDTIYTQFK